MTLFLTIRSIPILFIAVASTTSKEEECAANAADPLSSSDSTSDCGCSSLNRATDGDAASGNAVRQPETDFLSMYSQTAARHNEKMVEIPPGMFLMGERKEKVHFPHDGEGPARRVRMSGFRIDMYEVSNAKFHDFVTETGYISDAERLGDSFVANLYLSEAVSAQIVTQVAAVPWWLPVKNATWKTPEGFDSALNGTASRYGERWQHPVVHMSWNDADAYCRWRNASLPTEAQWEYAARGGRQLQLYPWGDEVYGNETSDMKPRHRLNIWQGKFPHQNTAKDKYIKTAPVDAYGKQNSWGLYNMVGNVWEYTLDWFSPVHFLTEETQKTGLIDPTGPTVEELDYLHELGHVKKDPSGEYEKVKKGGSFMCHKSYCWRYRVCARSHVTQDSSAHHTGFRCVRHSADEEAAHWSKAEVPEELNY